MKRETLRTAFRQVQPHMTPPAEHREQIMPNVRDFGFLNHRRTTAIPGGGSVRRISIPTVLAESITAAIPTSTIMSTLPTEAFDRL